MRLKFRNDFIAKTPLAFGRARNAECNRPARESELGVARLRLRVQFALLLLFLTTISPVTARNPLPAARGTAVIVAPRSFPANGSVVAVEAVGMTVSDIDRSVEFFTKVLSFEKVSDVEVAGSEYEHLQGLFGLRMRVVRLKLGDEFLELTEYLTPRGRPIPVDSRSNDRWFQHVAIITSDMDRAYGWLRKNKVQHASTGPQKLPETIKPAAGIRAFYFKDPDGHALEVLQFPADKGASKWHQPSNKLFLGIDHTAIVVSDTDASLRFYRVALGLSVAGESENFGSEQEHLNNVFGARLRITALRAASGPGIEFLEYLTPRDGRPAPADEKASDLIHWQTKLVTTDASAMAARLRADKFAFVSSGLVQMPDPILGFMKGVLVRDPDGHVMELIEK
ncbi:MAG TPA: VOC family protein [Blastocatellia bacterium]|nr:VOC family protein [Blastocatellia bacterium]